MVQVQRQDAQLRPASPGRIEVNGECRPPDLLGDFLPAKALDPRRPPRANKLTQKQPQRLGSPSSPRLLASGLELPRKPLERPKKQPQRLGSPSSPRLLLSGLELPGKPLERPKKRPRLEHSKTCPRRDSREWRRDHQ